MTADWEEVGAGHRCQNMLDDSDVTVACLATMRFVGATVGIVKRQPLPFAHIMTSIVKAASNATVVVAWVGRRSSLSTQFRDCFS